MFREGPDGFKGGLSAGKYRSITGASPATTTRDLADLTEKGALIREGERRHARYKLSVPLRPVPHISWNERGELVESERISLRTTPLIAAARETNSIVKRKKD